MAGHSKWSNTKHRKAIKDIKKGKRFTKLIKELANEVSNGSNGLSINNNQRIKTIVNKAVSNNIPKKTIAKTIIRNTNSYNEKLLKNLKASVYENYGPGKVVIIICSYNNNEKATKEPKPYNKSYAESYAGDLLATAYNYLYKGIIALPLKPIHEVIPIAIESKAEDIIIYKTHIGFYTNLKLFNKTKEYIKAIKVCILESNIIITPLANIRINKEDKSKLVFLIKNIIKAQYRVIHNAKF